jgi:hypothetical protein
MRLRGLLAFGLILSMGGAAIAQTEFNSPKDVFDLERAHTIHIKMSADAWEKMQPGAAAGKIAPNATREEAKKAGVSLRPNGSGYGFVLSEIEFNGHRIADVGIRFKGNSTYSVSAHTIRRPMKVDFDRFVEGGKFAKIKTLNLSNTTFDQSHMREAISFWLFRKLDVPASRTGFGLVYLNVPGKFEREYLGLYTLIEEVDGEFLEKHYGNKDGLLLKPGGMRGLAYLGDKWDQYVGLYSPRTDAKPEACAKVIELARLIHKADDREFAAKIESVLAVDQFLRYVAVTSAVINFDSFLGTGHNYYMYVNPKDRLIHFIPWDHNMTFGGYGWVGTPDELARTSITRAYADHNHLIERVLEIPKFAAAYRSHMHRLSGNWFNPEQLNDLREKMKPAFMAAGKATSAANRVGHPTTRPVDGMGLTTPELWPFIEKRAEWIRMQLDGTARGFKPEFSNPKCVLEQWAPVVVAGVTIMDGADQDGDRRLTDPEVKEAIGKLFAAANLPAESSMDVVMVTGVIEKIIPEELNRRVPAKAWGEWVMSVADANRDGRVTAVEMVAVYERYQREGDFDRDGRMDLRELLEQLGPANAPRDPDPKR